MLETEIFQLIGNSGFPIAITIYLLVRFERKKEGLKDSIDNFADHLAGLKK